MNREPPCLCRRRWADRPASRGTWALARMRSSRAPLLQSQPRERVQFAELLIFQEMLDVQILCENFSFLKAVTDSNQNGSEFIPPTPSQANPVRTKQGGAWSLLYPAAWHRKGTR